MNPYSQAAAGWAAGQYAYGQFTAPGAAGNPAAAGAGGYNASAYYANAAAAAAGGAYGGHPGAAAAAAAAAAAYSGHQTAAVQPTQPNQANLTTIRPAAPKPAQPTTSQAAWRQIKQQQQNAPAASNPPAPAYFPTKTFVKASTSTPAVGGDGKNKAEVKSEPVASITPSSTSSVAGMADEGQSCMKLHEIAVMNKIVETYEKITTEVAPGIHGVRLKFGTETFTGTGPNYKAAKQNAAATALAQTKYPKPTEKKTMKVRPHGITATQELHELATKKGLEAKFRFLEPPNFEFKSAMRLWSKDEMRGNYRVQLSINGYEYFGQADLPQQAKHNSAMQALPMLNRIPDAASATKVQVVVPMTKANQGGGAPSTQIKTEKGAASGGAAGGTGGGAAGGGGVEVSKNVIMILNEIAMSKSKCMDWTMVKEEGPPHARKFTWSLKMGEFETTGAGCSKRIAKSLAAQAMYEKIPDDWKMNSGGHGYRGNKRKGNNQRGGYGGMKRHGDPAGPAPGGAKKSKGPEDDGTPKPAYSVIQATNPISALYEYCRKIKAPDPDFECVSENVLETWQRDNHTFKKTEYTLKLQVKDKQFFASGQTKKAAKTAVATEAWNQLRIENI